MRAERRDLTDGGEADGYRYLLLVPGSIGRPHSVGIGVADGTDTTRSIRSASAPLASSIWSSTHTAAIQLAPLLAASLTSCSSVLPVMAHQWMIRTPSGLPTSARLAGKAQASPAVCRGTAVISSTWKPSALSRPWIVSARLPALPSDATYQIASGPP